MNAKHLTKNAMSHKLVFLAVAIAIAIIATFSICATMQAIASEKDEGRANDVSWILRGSGGPLEIYGSSTDTTSGIDGCNAYDEIYNRLPVDANQISILVSTQSIQPQTNGDYNSVLDFTCSYLSEGQGGWLFLSFIKENCEENELGSCSDETVDIEMKASACDITTKTSLIFSSPGATSGLDISGVVTNNDNVWQPVAGAFVQYCQWNPWFWDYVPVPEMNTFTDWFGNYTIEGVTEDMFPGVIRVYRFGYEVGESAPIGFVPEGIDTIYRFVEMTPAEPPVPPVPPTPPTPPDPPVPPVPPQPDPPQPVPPTPVPPTPVDPGTNIPQTGDSAAIALAIASMIALCGASGFAACAKSRRRSK